MRILVLIPSPYSGGAERYAITICRALVQAGHEVIVSFNRLPGLDSLRRQAEGLGAHCRHAFLYDYSPRRWRLLANAVRSFCSTLRLLVSCRPGRVFVSMSAPHACLGPLLACGLLRARSVVCFHLVPPARFAAIKRRLLAWAKHRNQEWTAVSQSNRDLLCRTFSVSEREIHFIPNGTPIYPDRGDPYRQECRSRVRAELGLNPSALILLTVGALCRRKGYDLLLQMVPRLSRDRGNICFVWIGEGTWRGMLEGEITRQGLQEHVRLLGERSDVDRWLHGADLFVFPTRGEGQSLVLLESMAARLPVVSTNVPGNAEIIENGTHGILCPPDDPKALLDSVVGALASPEKMVLMARAAQERVKEFSEAEMVNQTVALIESV